MDLIQHEIATTEKATVSYSMEDPNTLNDSTPFSKLEDLSHLADNNDSNNSDKETDIGSFVVLGKDSMDAIQASSLASYVDIQQKSMLVVCILQFYIILILCYNDIYMIVIFIGL